MKEYHQNKIEQKASLVLEFTPESEEFVNATEEYIKIWREEGAKMMDTLERTSGLKFKQRKIDVVVFGGVSDAGIKNMPMRLNAGLGIDAKKAVLTHELGHRLLMGNGLRGLAFNLRDLEYHKWLFLIFYDVLKELYGEQFADNIVKIDSRRPVTFYKEAWGWALSFTVEQREEEFRKLVEQYSK